MKSNKLAQVIHTELKKSAYSYDRSGHNSNDIELLYDDIELIIDGQKKVCAIALDVHIEFDWYVVEDTYFEPGYSDIDNIDYWINSIAVDDNSGRRYEKVELDKILSDNEKELNDLIEDDVETKAYDMDWEAW